MSGNTSSAEPQTLLDYCRLLAPLDQHVVASSASLAGDLASFESSCTEYPVRVGYLADTMAAHGRRANETDEWVKTVGDGFLWADASAAVEPTVPAWQTPDFWNDLADWIKDAAEVLGLSSGVLIWLFFGEVSKYGWYYLPKVKGVVPPFVRALAWLRGLDPARTAYRSTELLGKAQNVDILLAILFTIPDIIIDINDRREGRRDTSQMISAILVDLAVGVGPSLLVKGATAALVAGPPGWVVLGIAVTGIALGVGLNWWMGKDGGVNREKAIDWVDRRISDPWTYVTGAAAIGGPLGIAAASGLKYLYGEDGAEHRQQVGASLQRSAAWVDDNVLQPVGNAINDAGERARGWIDNAAANLINRRAAVGAAV